MVKVSKLAALFQLLFFCLALISILITTFLSLWVFRQDLSHQLDILLKNLVMALFGASPAFFSIYQKLKKEKVSLIWKVIPLITNIVLIFLTLFYLQKIHLPFALIGIVFLLLSSFFGSLSLFQIVKIK